MDDIKDAIVHDALIPRWTSIPFSVTSAYSDIPSSVTSAYSDITSRVTSTYSDITAKDNSRIHNGHNFHSHQYYIVQHDRDNFAGSSSHATLKRKRSLADIEATPRTRKAQESLDTAVKKLGKLSLSVRHRKEGDGAEKIARRIAALFEAITTSEDASSWDKTTIQQLGKLGATVKWEQRFDINSAPRRKSMNTCVKARRRQILVRIGHFVISLTTESFDVRRAGGIHEVETRSTLRVEPQHCSSRSALVVFFSEHWDGHSTMTIPPTVVAYKTVKDDSQVFQLVKLDDLDGLLRLLAGGEASIYDCDECGRSLLHNPTRITPASLVRQYKRVYKERGSNAMLRDFVTRWSRSHGFRKLSSVALETFLYQDLFDVPVSQLLIYLKESSPYLDFQERFDYGRGYWLKLCSGAALRDDPTLLQTFVDKGADIAEVDDHGFNCLFVFMSVACQSYMAKDFKVLQRLLTIFHDIHALDNTGNNVFAYVNERRDWPPRRNCGSTYDCGSYRQDLWYCALKRGKLDVRYNVQPCSRLARYAYTYTPAHYMALCYLDDWNSLEEAQFERQIQTLLQEHPMSEDEERIQREMDSQWGSDSDSDCNSKEDVDKVIEDPIE